MGDRGAEAVLPAEDPQAGRSPGARASPSPTPAPTSRRCETRAELDGDEWVINGQKIWTTQGFEADYIFVLCRTDPDAPKHKGISYLLCPMHQEGIEVRRIEQVDGIVRVLRGLLQRRPVPRGERRRRCQQRVEGGHDHPRLRARLVAPPPATGGSRRSSTRSSTAPARTARSTTR
ncbi:MAG: acyl-CoA dehydrogenase family protein [Acidimicrobiia bacterium]|nr:acyl-CoA dehydrogenase family protein [Acidimicrobiia bacterium]